MRRKMHNDDAVVQEIIDEVVDKFISEKKMFTLYDVTVEARNVVNTKITDRRVPIHHYGTTGVHDVILNSVNALIGGDADWDRQIITPKGLSPASKKPQLYHLTKPMVKDLLTYLNNFVDQGTIVGQG
jgi:hypothetical protein